MLFRSGYMAKRKPNPTDVVMSANDFFIFMKEHAADRPSAYIEYCRYRKIRGKIPELPTHEWEDLEPDGEKHVLKVFGSWRAIPPALVDNDWDT